jgi:hypothetical protein
MGMLNPRTLEIAPAAPRGMQLQPHPQPSQRQVGRVADPAASKLQYVQSMVSDIQVEVRAKDASIHDLVRSEAVARVRTHIDSPCYRRAW